MNEPGLDLSYLMVTARRPGVVMAEGSGSWLTDSAGRRYLDFVQGWAVNCLGHSPPVVVEALTRQASRLINCGPAYFNEPAARAAATIASLSFGDRTFFTNSGAEANEGAIKLARKWGQSRGAYEIITMAGAFHGRTLATMSATGKPQWRELFEPKVPGFVQVPLNDLAAVEAAIGPKTVAVMLEPIQGEGGVVPASDDFLRGLRELTKEKQLLLIADEVQTGVGRTGQMWGYQASGITPDIMTLGKGLGGGLPAAALVTREDLCVFEPGDQGGTFNGGPVIGAVMLAVLQTVGAPEFLAQVRATSEYFQSRLRELSTKHGQGEVRGRGLLLALALRGLSGQAVVREAAERNLLVNSPREDALRFMPALNVSRAEVDEAVELLDAALTAARA
ncbi:MAG: putative bifunctional N-succinyl-diaminopimelate aminotransferase/acetylornithine transaminase [Polyangiaceae bacterium]|jgi:acetylornithine/N-succinyldiaminopimelate aminotransferase|nr:putative bifunctional N-succinyl-diaminopimelate aminotransferase/acetylornithine transaminase [Polyangiaceae bacterium]